MKKTILFVGLLIIVTVAAYVFFRPDTITYVNTEPEVITKEIAVDPLEAQIKKRNEELEELYRKAQNLEASIDVRKAEIARLEEANVADQKELANFIQAIASRE